MHYLDEVVSAFEPYGSLSPLGLYINSVYQVEQQCQNTKEEQEVEQVVMNL